MKKNISAVFKEFVYEYEYVKRVSSETIRGYKNAFNIFYKLIPEITTETLSSNTLIQFFKILQTRKRIVGRGIIKVGVKTSTVASYWNKLNTFFNWLEFRGYIKQNPLCSITCPTPVYSDRKYLPRSSVEKLLTAIHMHYQSNVLVFKRNIVIFYIFLFCGLRREELLQLQVRDVDITKRQLTIRGETSKSKRSRQLPIHPTLIMHIKDYLIERKAYTTPYLIVSGQSDNGLTEHGLKHFVKRLIDYSKVQFHLHQFRHTFAVNFLRETNNLVKLKQLLGHKDISMTVLYLRNLPPEEMRGDIDCMSIDNFI